MNNAVFGKTMENVRKHRDIKLVKTDKRRNQLVSEPNYHTSKHFSENLLAMEMKKTKVNMNKPRYLGMSILGIGKTLMYNFWYDCIQLKYQKNLKLCYIDTESFVIHIKTEDFYKYIADDVAKWFHTSTYSEDDDKLLRRGINKKKIVFLKDELGGKIMKEFVALRPKTYSYLLDEDSEHKKAKGTKKCVIQRRLKFIDYKDCLLNNKIILKSQQRFRSEKNNVYTDKINKIVLSSNDDKRLRTFDKITTYPYGTNAFEVCESKMLYKYK